MDLTAGNRELDAEADALALTPRPSMASSPPPTRWASSTGCGPR